MKSLSRVRFAWFAGFLFVLILVLAACAPDATSEIISPELGPRLMAAQEAGAVVAVVEEEAELASLADLSEEEIIAGLPDDVVAALADAEPANGENLALVNGCIGCHSLDPEAQMTGPTWHNAGNVAITRVEGMGPAAYLYSSIVAPNDSIVTDYQQGLMPQNYAESISADDLADLVAYLLSQQEAAAE